MSKMIKNFRKAFSTTPRIKAKSWALSVSFLAGYFAHLGINAYKRREHWEKVNRMSEENTKRTEELWARYFRARREVVRGSSS